jgi:hypothetical protein
VDTHSNANLAIVRPLMPTKAALGGGGRADCGGRGRERSEQRVAF